LQRTAPEQLSNIVKKLELRDTFLDFVSRLEKEGDA
jgi:hypothetical protein